MTRSTLHIIKKPVRLKRPIGTSVQYVRYEPTEAHLKFARQHNRKTGYIERTKMPYTYAQIFGGILAGIVLAYAGWAMFL